MARLIKERSDVIPLLAEIFRTYGYEGASLARISEGTRLGKGSLYHFFSGGKEEMAAAVLEEIDAWFRLHVFEPLRNQDPAQGIARMFDEVRRYFRAGDKVCLVGVFALGNERDRFGAAVQQYFAEWADALQDALARTGRDSATARALSEEILIVIQGALVLARAWSEPDAFMRALERIERRLS